MEALKEVTGGLFPAHTYLLDGTTLIAYIRAGETQPFKFKNGIKGFDKRARRFEKVDDSPFTQFWKETTTIRVQGSKGNVYEVDPEGRTCTCPGFNFRGICKHVNEL